MTDGVEKIFSKSDIEAALLGLIGQERVTIIMRGIGGLSTDIAKQLSSALEGEGKTKECRQILNKELKVVLPPNLPNSFVIRLSTKLVENMISMQKSMTEFLNLLAAPEKAAELLHETETSELSSES